MTGRGPPRQGGGGGGGGGRAPRAGGRGAGGYQGGPQGGPQGGYQGDNRGFRGDRARGDRGGQRGGRGGRGGRVTYTGPPVYLPPSKKVSTPSETVRKHEDGVVKAYSDPLLSLSKLKVDREFPQRPGYGTRGNHIVLWANYIEMKPSPKLNLERYDISVAPEVTGKKLEQVVRLLLAEAEFTSMSVKPVSDMRSTLLVIKRLPEEVESKEWSITYRAENEDTPSARAVTHTVKLQWTGQLSVRNLMSYLTSTDPNARFDDKMQLMQAFNIFLRHHAKESNNVAAIGASKSFKVNTASETESLSAGLQAIRGFFSSVRLASCRILVNVNVSHGAFYKAQRLDQAMEEFKRGSGNSVSKLEAFLKRVKVHPNHLPQRTNQSGRVIQRIKTISGFATPNDGRSLTHPPKVSAYGAGAKNVEFWLETGPRPAPSQGGSSGTPGGKKGKGGGSKQSAEGPSSGRFISVANFFKQTYNLTLENEDMPVVNVGNRQHPIYLPAQVCMIAEKQPCSSKLSANQTAEMIKFAVRHPVQNATSIIGQGLDTVGLSAQTNRNLDAYGVQVEGSLITVHARILNGPRVRYHNNKTLQVSSGSWNMINTQLNERGTLKNWGVLLIKRGNKYKDMLQTPDQVQGTARMFADAMSKLGLTFTPPSGLFHVDMQSATDAKLKTRFEEIKNKRIDFLWVLIPEKEAEIYKYVKTLGDVEFGIQTVCSVVEKTQAARADQYFANVGLKVNLKLGGVNQVLEPNKLGIIEEGKTMVVGLDVTHPSPGSPENAPSVAGIVASTDRRLGQWPAAISVQKKGEMVVDLKELLKSRLKIWRTKNSNKLPENILVYRDGVSEGEYKRVVDLELKELEAGCKDLYPAPDTAKGLPRITIAIVGKRHHTRFYPTREEDADKTGNTKSGTVVDRGITDPHAWDCYIQAHSALHGTARPAHYYIVHDEIFRKVKLPPGITSIQDAFEDLTHNMCYTFGRATKAVSVCTPAYYADLVCERARCYLSDILDTPLDTASVGGQTQSSDSSVNERWTTTSRVHPNIVDKMFYI